MADFRTKMRALTATLVMAMVFICNAPYAIGQGLPNKPIRIIVPAAAGGGLDLVARVVSQKAAEFLGQTVYVENKPGANWVIGMEYVARAAPDGSTLLLLSASGLSINPHVFKNVPPLTAFAPITLPTKGTFVLLTNPELPVGTVDEFIAYLQAHPGKLNHASNSSSTILLSEIFKSRTKTEYVDINYRGGAQSVSDTMAGVTQFCFVDLGSAMSYIQNGSLRPMAITSAARHELVLTLPTLSEVGVDLVMEGGTALVAPAGLPRPLMEQLSGAFLKALLNDEVKKRFEAIGQVVLGGQPDTVAETLKHDSERWEHIVALHPVNIIWK
jgi:hypothetical protein